MRRKQLKASVSFFYLLTGVFLIAFVEKLVPDIMLRKQKEKEFITGRYGNCFSGKAITAYFVANKKRYSCWLLLILWVSQIAYSYVVNVRKGVDKQFATRTKTKQTLTALNIKLLKTVAVNVFETR